MPQERVEATVDGWSIVGKAQEDGRTVIRLSTTLGLDDIPGASDCSFCNNPEEKRLLTRETPANGLDIIVENFPGYKCIGTECGAEFVPINALVGFLKTSRTALAVEDGQEDVIAVIDSEIVRWDRERN